jgi:hypothetical protein
MHLSLRNKSGEVVPDRRTSPKLENALINKCRATSRNKDNRKGYLRNRARELAMSGRFDRWQSIEFELMYVEGLPEARTLLAGRSIRKRLDMLCRQARTIEARRAVEDCNSQQSGSVPGDLA